MEPFPHITLSPPPLPGAKCGAWTVHDTNARDSQCPKRSGSEQTPPLSHCLPTSDDQHPKTDRPHLQMPDEMMPAGNFNRKRKSTYGNSVHSPCVSAAEIERTAMVALKVQIRGPKEERAQATRAAEEMNPSTLFCWARAEIVGL